MKSLTEIQNKTASIQKDYKLRLDSLNSQLASAKFEKQKEQIQKRILVISGIYDRALDHLKDEQLEAEKVEMDKAQKIEAERLNKEEELKVRASDVWKNAGGNFSRFEDAWPSIRETLLNEKVVASLLGSEKENNHISGSIKL